MSVPNSFTSYFANVRNLPSVVAPIAICVKAPDGWTGLHYPKLAPPKWLFWEWKKNHDETLYIDVFTREILQNLDPDIVWNELLVLSGGRPFALICFEKPGDFCHRHLVSEWLRRADYPIYEWTKL